MNQLYAEASVKRKETAATMGLRILIIIGMLIGLVCVFLGNLYMLLGGVIIVALLYAFPRLSVEFEYIFVDGQIDFDKIIGKSKRKTIMRIDMEKVDLIAPFNSKALDEFKHIQAEVKNFSDGDVSKIFVMYASVGNNKVKILFNPSEQMIEMMRQKSPRKVIQF